MSYVIDNQATQNGYVPALTLDNIEVCQKINVSISNAAVKVQEKLADASGSTSSQGFQQEYTLAPGDRSLIRRGLVGIRFRSAFAGASAQVTCVAFPPHEG